MPSHNYNEVKMKKIKFKYDREKSQNPYIGFTSFQHFRNDELYSDLIVLPENNMTETEHVETYPVPDYVEEKGRAQGYYPDCSVVYIRILWKEFEPTQGGYRYAFIEDILKKAEQNGQTVMFRLMPHSTRESDDVPDWVKTLVKCPVRPEGAREKISPSDPKFLRLFGNAIRALGEKFDGNPTLAYVDVSLPGAWGEGSSCFLFTKEQLKDFADIYTKYYPNTRLIGQISEPWLVHYMNESANVGWRADCIGRPNLLHEFVPSMQVQMPDIWKTGHVSFESYWWLGEWKRKGWDLDEIIQSTLDWHISTFNAKSLPIPMEWQGKIEDWIAKMGYHFVIDSVCVEDKIANKKLRIRLCVENVGVAPIYHPLPLRIKLKGEKELVLDTDVDIRKWVEGKYTEEIALDLPTDLPTGVYSLRIGLGGGEYPVAYFATNAPQEDGYSLLTTVEIIG